MSLKISAIELKKRLDKRNNGEDSFILLDVRSINEQEISRIPDTDILIPITEFEQNISKLEKYKTDSRDIIIYCRVGIRSYNACQILYSNGYKNVYNLIGGIISYIEDVDSNLAAY